MRRRPLGITLLSLIYTASGLVTLLLGLLVSWDVVEAPDMYRVIAGGFAGAFMVAYGMLLALIGWGLYNFRLWAWALALTASAASTMVALLYPDPISILVNATIAAYLLLQHGYYTAPRLPPRAMAHYVRQGGEYRFVRRKKR